MTVQTAAVPHSESKSDSKRVDIAIVGGAMVGATLALGLAKLAADLNRPLNIALIEAHRSNEHHPGFDARSIAISHGSVFELTRLGIWPKLAHLGTQIKHIHVSDRGHFGMAELNCADFHLQSLGQVVELESVGQVLFSLLEASEVELYCPAKLVSVEATEQCQILTLDDGTVLSTSLLVAADGVNSQVRQAFKLPLERADFNQVGIIANVETSKPHHNWAYERFTESGPLAILPMSGINGVHRLSLVWSLTPEDSEHLLKCSKAEFIDELQATFGSRAGQFISIGERYAYPLMLSYMQRPIYHRTVFIGNAAQTLHPIAGQGFNLGLRDLVCLLDVVKQAIIEGDELGSAKLTHHYLQSREQDRGATLCNIEFLVRGFSNDYWPLVVGRNIGLRLLSWLPPLKVPVASRAMGWRSPR